MSREETLAYQRGYHAGKTGRWPAHKPPMPPSGILEHLGMAARMLRDEVDSALATFEPDDELAKRLAPFIDQVDEAMVKLSQWIDEQAESPK